MNSKVKIFNFLCGLVFSSLITPIIFAVFLLLASFASLSTLFAVLLIILLLILGKWAFEFCKVRLADKNYQFVLYFGLGFLSLEILGLLIHIIDFLIKGYAPDGYSLALSSLWGYFLFMSGIFDSEAGIGIILIYKLIILLSSAGILFVGLKKAGDDLIINNKKELSAIVIIYALYFLLAIGTYLAIWMV